MFNFPMVPEKKHNVLFTFVELLIVNIRRLRKPVYDLPKPLAIYEIDKTTFGTRINRQ